MPPKKKLDSEPGPKKPVKRTSSKKTPTSAQRAEPMFEEAPSEKPSSPRLPREVVKPPEAPPVQPPVQPAVIVPPVQKIEPVRQREETREQRPAISQQQDQQRPANGSAPVPSEQQQQQQPQQQYPQHQQRGGGQQRFQQHQQQRREGRFGHRNWRRRGEDLPKETLKVSELFTKPEAELFAQAAELGVEKPESYQRKDLIRAMLKKSAEKNNLILSEGYLEILPDGFGFLRRAESNYVSAPDDVYVSPSQIRRFNLQKCDLITGQTRPPKEKERYYALLKVDLIWGEDPDARAPRKAFDYLTAYFPKERLVLETDPKGIEMRTMDLLAPLGMGQRGLIVAPPRAGKTILLEQIANSINKNHPGVHLIVLLIDERPEEVTNMRRAVKGEVVSSTFDEQPERHVQVADMVIEKAKRLVEHKVDVVILLDSITRLARAHNAISRGRKKTMSGGMDAEALAKPKKFFGSARKVEEGGSLTIIATALVETGSRMDDLIYEEFKGTGNMEVTMDRGLAEARIFPCFAVDRSGTRNEELLYHPDEYKRICQLRKVLAEVPNQEAMELLIKRLKATKTNAEFLMSLNTL